MGLTGDLKIAPYQLERRSARIPARFEQIVSGRLPITTMSFISGIRPGPAAEENHDRRTKAYGTASCCWCDAAEAEMGLNFRCTTGERADRGDVRAGLGPADVTGVMMPPAQGEWVRPVWTRVRWG
jgi:hypothetical protein